MLSFHVKFMQTDSQTDGQTDTGKTICPPIFRYGGIKTLRLIVATSVLHGISIEILTLIVATGLFQRISIKILSSIVAMDVTKDSKLNTQTNYG